MTVTQDSKPKWERVLWKRQPYPDNYVEKNFIRVEKKVEKIIPTQAYYGCSLITQEISCCFGLLAAYGGLESNKLAASELVKITAIFCILAYFTARRQTFINILHGLPQETANIREEFKVVVFAIGLCWASTPIVKTLTASIATDTIQAMTTTLLFLHLFFHNYGISVSICNATMSSNLGLFASVCLGSRLHDHSDVFALMLLSVVLFTLVPSFRKHCQESSGKISCLSFTIFMFSAASFAVWEFYPSLMVCFLLVATLVNVVAPSLFLYLQPYRQNIYGPWDEATIKEKLILMES